MTTKLWIVYHVEEGEVWLASKPAFLTTRGLKQSFAYLHMKPESETDTKIVFKYRGYESNKDCFYVAILKTLRTDLSAYEKRSKKDL